MLVFNCRENEPRSDSLSYVKCQVSSIKCQMSNAYVDPWDMPNNFCFHVYAQNSCFGMTWHGSVWLGVSEFKQ